MGSDGTSLATLSGHTSNNIEALELRDGRLLSWGLGRTLRLWGSDGTPLMTLSGHTNWVNGALELKNGWLLSWGFDGTLRLWGSDGVPLATLSGHTKWVDGALELKDGRLLSWGFDGTLRLWYVNAPDFIAYACTRVFRDFTKVERQLYGITDTIPTCDHFGP